MDGSALYLGTVRHRRSAAPRHDFAYRVWYALLDLDELPKTAARSRWFSHNRFNLTGFDDRDHMGPTREPVRRKLDRWLRTKGIETEIFRVSVLTHLRVLGYVFNPVSFYFCRDRNDSLRHVVAEVNNTFGETYCYLLSAEGDVAREEREKVFHVSPFQPVDGRYRFRVRAPGDTLSARIDVVRDGEQVLSTALSGSRHPLTDGSLFRTVVRHPHTGLRTLALIHYQALRLWLKRAQYFPKPEPAAGAWRTRSD